MTRRSKKDKGPSALRTHLATSVRVLRDRKYKALPTKTARNQELAKDTDVSRSQIERIISGELGASVDIIEALAVALDVRPQDLLTPYFTGQPQIDDEPIPPKENPERPSLRRRQSS